MVEHMKYGLNAASKDYDGKNKYLRITDIDEESREFLQVGLTSPDVDVETADEYLLKVGDLLFARTGASVGKTYRYTEKDGKVYFAGFLICARIKSGYDSEFVFQGTFTPSYSKFVQLTSLRSGQPGINAQEYRGCEIVIPSKKDEQAAIGSLFSNFDKLIISQAEKTNL